MKRFACATSFVLAIAAVGAAATPAAAQRWDWAGGRPGDRAGYRLIGPGVPLLYPELRRTPRGRAFVLRNFDLNRDGIIDPGEARAANHAFLAVAGDRVDRFDWAARDRFAATPGYDRAPPAPLPAPGYGEQRPGDRPDDGGWDRHAMRDYHFRQTQEGATFDLKDVLFETGSADLRPNALDRLKPLAAYLRAHPQQRVSIVGHTDAVGSVASNQALSEHRADAVHRALVDMGAPDGGYRVEGRGESAPVASNDDAAGRQLNRRVEVTLLGTRADTFGQE